MHKIIASLMLGLALTSCTQRASVEPEPQPHVTIGRAAQPLTATQDTVLVPLAPAINDQAGTAVALSGDGTLAFVGVYRDDAGQFAQAGSVRVFSRVAGSWTQTAVLQAPSPNANAQFGFALAVSNDGTRVVVGAPQENTVHGSATGNAHVFVRVGSSWTYESALLGADAATSDLQGFSVAISGDGTRAFVGAPGDEAKSGPSNAGAVRVFVRNASGWNEETTLKAGDAAVDDSLGSSLAASDDGAVLVIGVRTDDTDAGSNTGSVRVFSRTDVTWSEDAQLIAFDGSPLDFFGGALGLSADGTTLLVGVGSDDTAVGPNVGSVRVFTRADRSSAWVERQTLVSPDDAGTPGFGLSLALRADGRRAVVGSPTANSNSGSARIFTLESAGWVADTALPFSAADAGTLFATAVAVSDDGKEVLVGAPLYDSPQTDNGGAVVFSMEGLALGFACTSAAQCVTGSCVDGYCCDTSCGGGTSGPSCLGCSNARTGLPNGTCGVMPSGAVCRASVGSCDLAELCDGVSSACRGDVRLSAGTPCRPATGPCDATEVCTGSSGVCPPDQMRPVGTVCRPSSVGPCDDDDICDGTTAGCVERFKPANTQCAPSSGEICDMPDVCTGTGTSCPPKYLSGVSCRPSVGACDLEEYCSGGSAYCPPDAVISAGIVCRASVGSISCDPAESCDGFSGSCPANVNTCGTPQEMMCPTCEVCMTPQQMNTPVPATGCSTVPAEVLSVGLAMLTMVARSRRRRP